MRRTAIIAPTKLYTTRHLYLSHIQRIKELALTKDETQEEVINDALGFGLDVLEYQLESTEECPFCGRPE